MRTADAAVASSVSPSLIPLRLPLPALIAAFCLLWASAFAVAKFAIADCPPLLLLTARFLLAGVVVLGTAALYRVPWNLGRRDLLIFALLGIANQAVYLGLSYVGIASISSGLAALVISANPVLTAVLAAVFLGERMSWRKGVGLLLGVAGVAFVVASRLGGSLDHPAGIAFMIAALISLVGGTILYKKFAPTGGLWIGNGVQSLAAGLVLLPFAVRFESIADIVPTWRLAASLAYLALAVSIFAYLIWFHLLDVSSATVASSYHFLMPPLGMMFGWLLLREQVAPNDILGIVPVTLGIYLVTHPARQHKQASAP
jgi:drug/metabolite transporter (DMT)-like permease